MKIVTQHGAGSKERREALKRSALRAIALKINIRNGHSTPTWSDFNVSALREMSLRGAKAGILLLEIFLFSYFGALAQAANDEKPLRAKKSVEKLKSYAPGDRIAVECLNRTMLVSLMPRFCLKKPVGHGERL